MSNRERAKPWWHEPLPPYQSPFGGEEIVVAGRYRALLVPLCRACDEPLQRHVAYMVGGYLSQLFCPGHLDWWTT